MSKFLLAVIAIAAVVFALQNGTPVTLTLVVWQIEAMLAVVVLGALTVGVCAGVLIMLPTVLRARRQVRVVRKEAAAVAAEVKR